MAFAPPPVLAPRGVRAGERYAGGAPATYSLRPRRGGASPTLPGRGLACRVSAPPRRGARCENESENESDNCAQRRRSSRESRKRRERLDQLVVSRGLAEDLPTARALIMAGAVVVDAAGRRAAPCKAGELVPLDTSVRLRAGTRRQRVHRHAYVSRGACKLAYALDGCGGGCVRAHEHDHDDDNNHDDDDGDTVAAAFRDAAARYLRDAVAMDIGASTGGFTQVLLQRGCKRVYAVDVAYGVLDYRLRADARVIPVERCNARYLRAADVLTEHDMRHNGGMVDVVACDVSFISLRQVLPPALAMCRRALFALVKPQFEASRAEVSRGGVVEEARVRRRVVREVTEWLERRVEGGGVWRVAGVCATAEAVDTSNEEYMVLAVRASAAAAADARGQPCG